MWTIVVVFLVLAILGAAIFALALITAPHCDDCLP